MIKKITTLAILTISAFGFTASSYANVWVNGHYKSSGSYVQPHYRSSPDGSIYNNWSYRGNTNPYTGKRGYRSY
jgi:hypothetical protein